MDYFVEGTVNTQNTVIEQAAIDRLEIFGELGRNVKMLLLAYSPQWTKSIPKARRSQVVSLFDTYQGCSYQDVRPFGLNALDETIGIYDRTEISTQDRLYHYTDGDRLVAKVHLFADNRVDTVAYVGPSQQVLEIDQYDVRGFLSRRQYWYGNVPTHAEYLSPEGQVRLEQIYDAKGKTQWLRLQPSGQSFASLAQLQQAFCQSLDQPQTVICDRREYDWLLANWPKAQRVLRLFNAAAKDVLPGSILVARKPVKTGPELPVIDEYADTSDLVAAWQELLQTR